MDENQTMAGITILADLERFAHLDLTVVWDHLTGAERPDPDG